jgi:hypothetical protein
VYAFTFCAKQIYEETFMDKDKCKNALQILFNFIVRHSSCSNLYLCLFARTFQSVVEIVFDKISTSYKHWNRNLSVTKHTKDLLAPILFLYCCKHLCVLGQGLSDPIKAFVL